VTLYAVKLTADVNPAEDLERKILESFKSSVVFPFYPWVQPLVAPAESGSREIKVVSTAEFESGFPLIVAQHRRSPPHFPIHYEYNFVNNIIGNVVYLRDPLVNSYKINDYVFPAMLGVPRITESRSMLAHRVFTVSLEVYEQLPTENLPPSEGTTTQFVYQPKTVVVHDNPVDRRDFWEIESGWGDTSCPSWSKNPIRVEHKYSFCDDTWKTLRDAFFYAKGRCKTINVPTWKDGTSAQTIDAYFTDDKLTLEFTGDLCQVKIGWEEAV